MPVQPIGAAREVGQKVKGAVEQKIKGHNPVNTYEFQLGFIPKSHPHGKGLGSDEQIERMIDTIV